MLIIQMPEGKQKDDRRKAWRALIYGIIGIIIMIGLWVADNSRWWWLPCIIGAWWLWASLTDPRIK